MQLASVDISPFRSIGTNQNVAIEKDVTVLVGMNEAGKTVFLQALAKSRDALGLERFDPVEDYPRKDLPGYLRKHKTEPARVTKLTFKPSDSEIAALNLALKTGLKAGFQFSVTYTYANKLAVEFVVDERPVLAAMLASAKLGADAAAAAGKATKLRDLPEALKSVGLTDEDKAFLTGVEARIAKAPAQWASVIEWEVWEWLKPKVPKFLYFSDYELLPSKVNLHDLANRLEQAKNDPKQLRPEMRAALALLRMADISVADFAKPGGYEPLKAKIEGVSISLTDQIMEFWKQNENLEVEVDIKADPDDEPPYNNGPNLYLRIKNRRHRGVSTPFRQRSRGFIWFFSFLVWFDSVRQQYGSADAGEGGQLILLLDEPGLNLHALAQGDFLRYIDDLSTRHQVIYTTHSPFMVHPDRLGQVRVVEDREHAGTVISEKVTESDPRTIFPLQAALGWSVAQNLFISENNLIVEGPADLIYLRTVSAQLEGKGREGLRSDVTIVPAGGLDKVATFIALLGASGLKLAVLHDHSGAPEQRLLDLVRSKMISPKAVMNVSQFRDLKKVGVSGPATDLEDLFTPEIYLEVFNRAFADRLGGHPLLLKDLPRHDRITERITKALKSKGVTLRADGDFGHYRVAAHFAKEPSELDAETLARFEALFRAVNALFGKPAPVDAELRSAA
jgi:hypothetical protein